MERPWSILVWERKHIQLADVLSRPECLFLYPEHSREVTDPGSPWSFHKVTSISRAFNTLPIPAWPGATGDEASSAFFGRAG